MRRKIENGGIGSYVKKVLTTKKFRARNHPNTSAKLADLGQKFDPLHILNWRGHTFSVVFFMALSTILTFSFFSKVFFYFSKVFF